MTSTPNPAKGKGKATSSGDWRTRFLDTVLTPESLGQLELPFEVIPEPKDTVPAQYAENVCHLLIGQYNVLFTGYYAKYKEAWIAVTNVYGIWFKVQWYENKFWAHHMARTDLNLKNHPLEGLQ